MIPTHIPHKIPEDLKDLTDEEGFFKLCKGDKQPKFSECTGCPFYDYPRTREQELIERGVNVLVVGGKPSKDDIPFPVDDHTKIGSEFRGRGWFGLRNFIKRNSIRNGEVIKYGLTTAVMCYDAKNKTRDYPIKAVRQCGGILRRKIVLSGATAVVLLGRQACKASPVPELQKITSIDHVRGKIFKQNMGGRDIYFVPSHSVRDINLSPDLWSTVLHDLEKATRLYIKGFKKPLINDLTVNYQYPESESEVRQLLEPLIDQPKKIVAFDIETTGLDPRAADASVTVFSLAWSPKEAAAIYTHKAKPEVISWIKKFLESSTKKTAHNAQFDIGYIEEAWGVKTKNLYVDTMLFHYLLDENRAGGEERTLKGEFTLKKLVWDFLPEYGGYEEGGDIAHHFKKGTWEEIPKDTLLKYAAVDADVTLQVFFKQLRMLYNLDLDAPKEELLTAMGSSRNYKEKALHGLATNFMPRATYGVVHMKNSGMYIDKPYLEKLCSDIPQQLEDVQQYVRDQTGKEVRLSNNKDISWVVYDHLGTPVTTKTTTGNPSTAFKTLEEISKTANSDIVDAVITYKKLHKLNNSFLTKIKTLTSVKTGRVHPSYLLIGTVTGRLSCRDPNLQQVPKYIKLPDGTRINVKKIFRSAPGKKLLYADFSQMEMAIMAAMCCKYGDESLKNAIINGLDLHCFVASEVFSIPYEDMFKFTKVPGQEVQKYVDLRSRAKTVGFAIIYGSTAYGMAYKQGITVKEAQQLIDLVFEKFPGIQKFVEASHAEAFKCGYVTSPFGRRRRFPISRVRNKLDNASRRKAQNFPIQSAASDICLRSVINLTEEISLVGGRVVVTVHDSLIVEVDNDPKVIKQAAEMMQNIMVSRPMREYKFLRGVPLKADIEIGDNWGEMETY
jgi:DNA polymerase-1